MPERIVLDCMLFLQALTNPNGPAFECFLRVEQGEIELLLSHQILIEVEDVLNRPYLRSRFQTLTDERVQAFLAKFRTVALLLEAPTNAFLLPRDRKDEPYTDLAIAGGASYLVTWNDRHLTYLMRQDTPEGKEFCHRFPGITILPPPDLLTRLRNRATKP